MKNKLVAMTIFFFIFLIPVAYALTAGVLGEQDDFFVNLISYLPIIEDYVFNGKLIHGEMWNYTPNATAWTFPIASAGIYYNLTNMTDDRINGFTFTYGENLSVGGSYLTAQVAGIYNAIASISFEIPAGKALFGVGIVRNWDVTANRQCYSRREGTQSVGSISVTCMIELDVGDTINIQIENEENTRDFKIHTANLNLIRIGD